MLDYVERMVNEEKELAIKVKKLNEFINGNAIFKNLPEDEQIDMEMQLLAMQMYHKALSRRLKRALSV